MKRKGEPMNCLKTVFEIFVLIAGSIIAYIVVTMVTSKHIVGKDYNDEELNAWAWFVGLLLFVFMVLLWAKAYGLI